MCVGMGVGMGVARESEDIGGGVHTCLEDTLSLP